MAQCFPGRIGAQAIGKFHEAGGEFRFLGPHGPGPYLLIDEGKPGLYFPFIKVNVPVCPERRPGIGDPVTVFGEAAVKGTPLSPDAFFRPVGVEYPVLPAGIQKAVVAKGGGGRGPFDPDDPEPPAVFGKARRS
jgi:hypothetical protein